MSEREEITPRCCDSATRTRTVVLRYSEEAMYRSRGQGGHTPRWTINGHEASFCPFCGDRLPAVRRRAVQPELVCRVSDGGYYCDTCGERLNCCGCAAPEAAWEPAS